MRQIRVCMYGGTDLQGVPTAFIDDVAFEILDSMPAVIVTGGFHHSLKKPNAVSTDVAALNGARRYATQRGLDLRACFEAWVPEPKLDGRPDVGGVVRMTEELGIRVREMEGKTALGRRLAMVGGVDLVVTISGKRHTEVVLEQALERGVPAFPIPVAGGDSETLLETYRERIAGGFADGALDQCLKNVTRESVGNNPQAAAKHVVKLLQTAKVGRCVVLLPYDSEHDRIYQSEIEPAVSEHMFPIRLDEIPSSDAIYKSFADAIDQSTAIIADITNLNENVMYEIGFAHGRRVTPLLYTTDPSRLENLPVYLETLNIRLTKNETELGPLIGEYLRKIKADRSTS